MYKILNRRFSKSESWEKVNSIIPSGYIRKGALQVFHRIRRSHPDDHILCIGYKRGDTQFAITETFKTYETSLNDVVDRCLQEECSMERVDRNVSIENVAFTYTEKYATIYCVPLRVDSPTSMRPCEKPSMMSVEDIDKDDDKSRKLVLLLHGPFEVIQSIFSQFSSLEDDISHLMSIPVSQVALVFPKLFPVSVYPAVPIYRNHPTFLHAPVPLTTLKTTAVYHH